MGTIRQNAANRENAKKSTGPTTPEGRAHSRRNAIKHGLSGYGIVLPDETEEQIQAKCPSGHKDTPDGTTATRPCSNRPPSSTSASSIVSVASENCSSNNVFAHTHWDKDRRDDAKNLFNKLHRNPLIHAAKLESTLQGCDLMIAHWEELLSLLETDKPWNEIHRSQARRPRRSQGYSRCADENRRPSR